MKGRTRWLWILLALALVLSAMASASAEVMTLGVWLRGIRPAEDGTTVQVPLEGSFRVTQGGLEAGIIEAGVNTVALSREQQAVLEPMPETFSAGWDLSEARVVVDWTDGNVTVPVLLRWREKASAESTPTPAPGAEELTQAELSETADAETPADSAEPDLRQSDVEPTGTPGAPTATPKLNMTPVPTAEITPAPDVGLLNASADTGAFHLKVFSDGNTNGACGPYEVGIPGIPVYLVNAEDQVVTGGSTDQEGEIILPGLQPGNYRVRVTLPEKWTFSRKSKETGLIFSILDFSSAAVQDSAPIPVKAGETVERGIGLLKGVMVSGTCWLDENANGIMEAGEPRLAGAHIQLSGQKNGLTYEGYSDANGDFVIYRLRPGFYDFISYTPEGMMFTRYSKTGGKNRSVFTAEGKTKATKTLDLNDGFNEINQNIGFTWTGTISGIAFLDANYNGLYDEGELPMPGVKVTAIKQIKEEEIAVAYSGEDGRYVLSGLRGNTYKIRAVLPEDGSDFTKIVSDAAGNHFEARENRRENFMKDFVLADGENREVNVGAIYYGSVSGTVYLDNDFSGTQSGGEKVAQGISVTLQDENGRPLETKQTGAKGTYSFTRLTPGTYILRMQAETGYAFTRPGEGNKVLNRTGGEGFTEPFRVPLGTDVTGMDAGMIRPAKVRGVVFADRNDNGKQDAGEDGLKETVVRLMSEEGEAFSARIGEDSGFLFDAVMPGRYYLRYELPEEAVFARNVSGGNTVAPETEEDPRQGRGDWFELRSADEITVPVCGGLTLGTISGTVFADHDGSGIPDAGEEALAGAVLILTPSRSELEEITVTTGADGAFRMDALRPDQYTLSLTLPEGMTVSRLGTVTLPIESGLNAQEAALPLSMGQSWKDQEIGAVKPGKLYGRLWLDENNNGLLEEEEQTPAGYELTLKDEDTGETVETLRTGEDGGFETRGLPPGSYALSFPMDEEMDAAKAGDSTFRKEGSEQIMDGLELTEGETRTDLMLGLVRYTTLGGKVWIDRGSGAENLSGAEVILLDEGGNPMDQQETGDDGAWRFTGLMPGTYRIRAELPAGAVAAEPDDERLDTGLISILEETDGRRGTSGAIDLIMGQDQLSLNIGSVLPGTIGDMCWLDENGNGLQDGGEYGIPHVKVELIRNGVAVAETETDQYGLYFFREVYPAVYTLRVTAPAEVRPTAHRTDIPLIASSLLETDGPEAETDAFAVQSDSVNFNIDLGYVLRRAGDYPEGYGEQETMDWSKTYTDKSQPE